MELRHLRYFVAIAEERNFTRAAERLWVAQPGLSTQIRRLEAELGVQLFDRHTRGVDLTDAGQLFLERARAALSAADAAGATGRDLQTGTVGTLRVGIATSTRCRRASALLAQYARERRGVQLTLLEGYAGTLWRDLRERRLDAVIAASGSASPDLLRLELGSEPWVALVGVGHRLATPGPMSAADLHGERVAVTAHRDGATYDRAVAHILAELGVSAALVPTAPGPALYAGVADGDVIALTTLAEPLRDDVLTRPLVPHRTLAFELLWRDETPAPVLSAFIDVATLREEQAAGMQAPLAAVA